PTLAVLPKLVWRSQEFRMPFDEREALVFEQLVRARLHVLFDEFGLVVEQLLLRRRAGHVQVNHILGLGRKHRRFWGGRVGWGRGFAWPARRAPHSHPARPS